MFTNGMGRVPGSGPFGVPAGAGDHPHPRIEFGAGSNLPPSRGKGFWALRGSRLRGNDGLGAGRPLWGLPRALLDSGIRRNDGLLVMFES